MDESRLQAEIRKYRFLLTKSLNINSISQVEADREGFFRALHREYKAAQDVIITAQLEIEADIASSTDEAERLRKEHWKAVTELCFNTLIWICLRWDRDRVKRVFKGPKHGSLSSRNAVSALNYVRAVNERWNDFAIALDFSRFECVADVLQVHLDPHCKSMETKLIEVKEGRVNEEMCDTIEAGSMERCFSFFDKYGPSGIKQMERFFRQQRKLVERAEIIASSGPGHFDTDEGKVLVQVPTEPRLYYADTVRQLLKRLESEPAAHFVVDGCLLVAGIRRDAPEDLSIGEFFLRHSIHHTFSPKCSFCAEEGDWMTKFKEIKVLDGLVMFGSVAFEGLMSKSLEESEVLDLLFGRIRMFYHLDGDRFIELYKALGLEAGYLTIKETNRLRSQGVNQRVLFRSRFLWVKRKSDGLVTYLAEGALYDMCLNWVHPYWWAKQQLDEPSLEAG